MSWQPLGFGVANRKIMLTDYRTWLESELMLLGNASHHAYSFGQANMAKRAIDRFDEDLAGGVAVVLPRDDARAALAALESLGVLPAPLAVVRDRLRAATEGRVPERPLRDEPPLV